MLKSHHSAFHVTSFTKYKNIHHVLKNNTKKEEKSQMSVFIVVIFSFLHKMTACQKINNHEKTSYQTERNKTLQKTSVSAVTRWKLSESIHIRVNSVLNNENEYLVMACSITPGRAEALTCRAAPTDEIQISVKRGRSQHGEQRILLSSRWRSSIDDSFFSQQIWQVQSDSLPALYIIRFGPKIG